ncbi:MAG: hypothetical protein QM718_11355 [Steroidobacteraceae bacterium]
MIAARLIQIVVLGSMAGVALGAGQASPMKDWEGGIYRSDPAYRGQGSPEAVVPNAAFPRAPGDQNDPLNECMPLGPFRMMARDDIRFEIVQHGEKMVLLFEELSLGRVRVVNLGQPHREDAKPTWQGEAVGTWKGNVLTLDTRNFNDRTWLNGHGVRHSGQLHLVETFRFVDKGRAIEYVMRAEDPEALQKPYSYTRRFRKDEQEFRDVSCVQSYPPLD